MFISLLPLLILIGVFALVWVLVSKLRAAIVDLKAAQSLHQEMAEANKTMLSELKAIRTLLEKREN